MAKDKDLEMLRLLRCPWRFISIITKSRSLDFYCDDEQIDNMFYGLKSFFVDYEVPFKINTTNYFILTKLKIILFSSSIIWLVSMSISSFKSIKWNCFI